LGFTVFTPTYGLVRQFIALSLFAAPLDRVRAEALGVLASSYRTSACELLPLPSQADSHHAPRATLWAPSVVPDRTAFMGHQEDGWYTLTHILATRLKAPALQLRATQRGSGRYVCDFKYWVGGDVVRTVQALDDEPWRFVQRGDPLPVEDLQRYRKRRICHRVTADYLVGMAGKLGWPVADRGFWQASGSAILLSGKDG
jgi:hypothetical protein